MGKEIIYPPLVSWKNLLKGVLGGSLLAGGLANPWGVIIQAILFLAGLFMIIDGIMVSVKGVFIVICLMAAIFGGALSLVLSVAGMGIPYLAAIIIISILLYFLPHQRPGGKRIGGRKETHAKPENPE
jgi:hypothetical protein